MDRGRRLPARRIRPDAVDARAVASRRRVRRALRSAAPLLAATTIAGCIAWRRDGAELRGGAPRGRTRRHLPARTATAPRSSPGERCSRGSACASCCSGWKSAWQPLYPWDAWTQWATKARVWFELGRIVPFASADAWFAADGAAYFDAAPGNPPTMPLLQVWACIALGRWDDALMNWPWWQIAVALALAVYGAMRAHDLPPLAALVVAFFVASLPLANVHVALAGYADLPLAAYYTCAVLALAALDRDARSARCRPVAWCWHSRARRSRTPGLRWAATLVPGVIVALLPARGLKIAAAGLAAILFLLAVLAQSSPTFLGYRAASRFRSGMARARRQLLPARLLESPVVRRAWRRRCCAWRDLASPALAPLTMIVAAGALLLFVVVRLSRRPHPGRPIRRPSIAPRCISRRCWSVFAALAFRAFALRWAATRVRRRARSAL